MITCLDIGTNKLVLLIVQYCPSTKNVSTRSDRKGVRQGHFGDISRKESSTDREKLTSSEPTRNPAILGINNRCHASEVDALHGVGIEPVFTVVAALPRKQTSLLSLPRSASAVRDDQPVRRREVVQSISSTAEAQQRRRHRKQCRCTRAAAERSRLHALTHHPRSQALRAQHTHTCRTASVGAQGGSAGRHADACNPTAPPRFLRDQRALRPHPPYRPSTPAAAQQLATIFASTFVTFADFSPLSIIWVLYLKNFKQISKFAFVFQNL